MSGGNDIDVAMRNDFKDYVKNNCLSLWPAIYPTERIMDIVLDNFPDISEETAEVIINECRAELLVSQMNWPAVTDCDLLDQAGAVLDEKDILLVQHLDTTPSSCWLDIQDILRDKGDGDRYIGVAYYHFQSTSMALEYHKMHINFRVTPKGSTDGVTGTDIRNSVVNALMEVGLQIPEYQSTLSYRMNSAGEMEQNPPAKNRDGDQKTAIEINPIDWKKRLSSSPADSS